MQSNEVEPKDLDSVMAQEEKEKMDAYNKRLESQGEGDFFKPPMVKDNDIKIVKFSKWLGMKMTTFKEGTNQDRPNFEVEVMVGKNVGTKYTANLTDATVRELKKQGMPADIGKAWCDKPLDVAIAKSVKGEYVKFMKHVNL